MQHCIISQKFNRIAMFQRKLKCFDPQTNQILNSLKKKNIPVTFNVTQKFSKIKGGLYIMRIF